jgi:hypothetical protein
VRFPNENVCNERSIEDFRTNLGFKITSTTYWYKNLIYFEPCHIAIDVLHQCFEGT